MSIVHVDLIEGVFSSSEKQQMIQDLTNSMLKFEGEAARETTIVLIREVKSGDWGKGGKSLDADDIVVKRSTSATSSSTRPGTKT